ncbi:hypothetical protein GPALN_012901 [Globodera pallida]|nr:hypothetical protein GPALN_012901 [Globodera pallida]
MVLISLNVKTIDGKDSVVRVDDEMPLGHLRNAIEASTGVPINDQRLIFRGRILKDELCSLNAQGFVDGLAVHVVTKPPPAPPTPNTDGAASQRHQQSEEEMGNSQVITQTLIVGQLLLERTSLFESPNVAMDAISGVLEEIRDGFQLETEASLRANLPNESFAVNVVLRGNREQTVNSPARERFEALKVEVKKLAWLVALIKAQFANRIDTFFSNQDEPSQQEDYQAIADILLAMHSFDHFDENTIKGFVERDGDQELITLIQELDSWQAPDDEAHLQTLNRNTIVRHCLSMDLSRLLVILSMVDAKINEHLMSRFNRILSRQHNLQSFSYAARLMNCFSSAFSRIQHARAHIYHSISDIGVHADENGMNRLFPQLLHYERGTEPPRADITLTFIPRGEPSHSPTPSTGTATRSSGQQNNTPLNTLLSGFMSIAQQLLGGGPNLNVQQRPATTVSSGLTSVSASSVPETSSSSRSDNSSSSSDSSRLSSNISSRVRLASALRAPPDQTLGQNVHNNPMMNDALLFGQIPQPIRNAQHQQRRIAVGLPALNWNQSSPEAPNALFIGPRPPSILPLFTIDPFLTCASRRYRVFESDSRHNDFWNDPETIRLGIRPPSNSVTAFANQQQNGGMLYHFNSGSDEVNRMFRHAQMNAQRERSGESVFRVGGNSSSTVDSQPSEQGETAFNNIDDFARFVRQIFHSVVRSLAQNDSSIMPSNSAQNRNGFTANSRVSGFTPIIIPSVSSRESDELLMNIGTAQGLVTVTIPSEGNQQQNVQQPPSTGRAPPAN